MNVHAHKLEGSRVLVTGGAGFIGSHLIRALLARGVARVTVIDSLRCGDPANLGGESSAVELIPFNLGTDPTDRLADALDGVDYMFHLAAEKHQASLDRPRELLRANIEGMHQLLAAAVDRKVKKVVFSSSLYAYGRTRGPKMREDEVPTPDTVYGVTKLAGEHLLAHFAAYHGLAYNTLRYFFCYGPRQFAGQGYKSVIVKTAERILAGQGPTVFGDGEQTLDYIYVDDVVEATILALEAGVEGEVLNIGSGEATSVNRLIDTLLAVSGQRLQKSYEPADWTAGSYRVGDVSKAQEVLGFTAKTSLEEGLSRTFQWLAENARSKG